MVTDNLMKGGKERRMLELLRYLENQKNIEVLLVLLKDRIDYPQVHDLRNTRLHIFTRKIKKDPTVFIKLWKLSRKFKPDVFHTWGSMPSVYTALITLFMRKPFLNAMIANAICKPFSKNWLRAQLTFPLSNIILANSEAGLKAFKVSPKKGRVIYNGFNMDRVQNLKPQTNIKDEYALNNTFVVGMVGAFHERKDYDTYLEVADKLSVNNENIRFLAVGDGKSLDSYKKKYSKNEKIIFTGNIQDVESLINVMDVGVLLTNPSVHLEGISNALIEFMALEKPVIASSGGGTDELILHGINGMLIEPLSKTNFETVLIDLINDKEKREKLGKNAKQDIKERFSIDRMVHQTLKLYQEMLK